MALFPKRSNVSMHTNKKAVIQQASNNKAATLLIICSFGVASVDRGEQN
jgi:hypothetical protein